MRKFLGRCVSFKWCNGGKVAKSLKIFKNVQKLYRNVRKLYRNIQKLHRNVQKYSTFLDADCAAKFSHREHREHGEKIKTCLTTVKNQKAK